MLPIISLLKTRKRHIVAVALTLGSCFAIAADQLVWSETYQTTSPRPPFINNFGAINTATLPGGIPSVLEGSTSRVKGPNGVEFSGGRIWWPDQQLGLVGSSLPDGSDFKSYNVSVAYDVDVQGSKLYVTRQQSNDIRLLDLSQPTPSNQLFKSGLTSPFAIDVTADYVYWSQVGSSQSLLRSSLDGSNVQTLLTNVNSYDFEVTGNHIYLTTTDGFVKRSNLDGTGLTTLASGLGHLNGIDVTDDTIYVSQLQGLIRRGFNEFLGAGRIYSMELDGSEVTELFRAQEIFDPEKPFLPSLVRGVAVIETQGNESGTGSTVSEPSTPALLLGALALVGLSARRRKG